MASPLVERRFTPHILPRPAGKAPRGVVVHTNQGTAFGTCEWFAAAESHVSAHYLVRLDGSVVQFVEESDAARHAGRILDPTSELAVDDPNLHTVGVEFEDGGDPHGVQRPDAQYRSGALLIRRSARRWGFPVDRRHVVGHREIFAAKDCPGNLDVDALVEAAAAPPRLACLLPVRNGEADLREWLDGVAGFADLVIALDDGSQDATREILDASPLVAEVLANPPRDSYAGWDDAANRQRLLDAAVAHGARWVFFLDADERLDPDDARALREFVEGDALEGCAYGLEIHRGWTEELVERRFSWGYRLFSPPADARLPERRLHFNPIPKSIPPEAWLTTTLRIRHLDSPQRLAARREKYEEADPVGSYGSPQGKLLADPGDLVRWEARPAGLPVLAPDRAAPGKREPEQSGAPLLACLLPVRNGEADLREWLDGVAGFADLVIALDDGSQDATREILDASPLVAEVLANPPRDSYAGWDDAANRQRLLDAAVAHGARWVFFLDADERLDPDDARALREFVEGDADPECAYGFRVYRMVDGLELHDRAELWVYRLFACKPGLELPPQRLHLLPIPASIPRTARLRTTLRIQHLGSASAARRAARLRKYKEADPHREWQSDYSALAAEPVQARPWRPRPPGLPVLADPLGRGPGAEIDLETVDFDAPLLSAIVIAREDEDRIEAAVGSVVAQECPEPFEVIVVVSGSKGTAEIVRKAFPQVHLVELAEPALPGKARNAGLAVARGEYVSFPGSHVELPPGSLAARVRAHERGAAMVTGSIVNGTPTPAGWASYFLDHAGALPGRPSGDLAGPPAHCSYVREFLEEIGGFPEHLRAGEDTVANRELWRRGRRAVRSQELRLVHRSRCTTVPRLLRHHFSRGRGLGRILLDDHRNGKPLLRPAILKGLFWRYLPERLARTDSQVRRWGAELRPRYKRVRPLAILGMVAAWLGLWVEILRPAPGKIGVLLRDSSGVKR